MRSWADFGPCAAMWAVSVSFCYWGLKYGTTLLPVVSWILGVLLILSLQTALWLTYRLFQEEP